VSLSGHLDLACAADEHGRTFIREQSFRAPFHLSKPYWDEHALIVQIVNPTAGVFAGDTLLSRVAVESGARLLLTTPSANRIHAMPSGCASVEQHFSVAEDGWLEVLPELFIPQAQCRYRQRTSIEVAAGGEMFFVETLAPGRVARGEILEFTEIDWQFELRRAGELVARERFVLKPSDESTASLRSPFAAGYYASCYLITERIQPDHEIWRPIHDLGGDSVLVGASRLVSGGSTIKVLAADNIKLTRTLRAIRDLLAQFIPALHCAPRKL
jgi:urease accessory protein